MAQYSLYYWPIPFRGHFIRYVLAYVGATWDEPGADAVMAAKNMPIADQPYPFLAPPLLVDREAGQTLSQMPAILLYLARKHRIVGDESEALRLVCDASDVLFEITRGHGAQLWDRASWQDFISERLPRWMQIHDRLARDRGVTAHTGWFAANTDPTLADLTTAALWHTMVDRLPALRPVLHAHAPVIEGLVARVAAHPPIADLLSDWQDRDPRYCAGDIEKSILDMLGNDIAKAHG